MERFLNSIRKPVKSIPVSRQLLFTFMFLLLGALAGSGVRFLDGITLKYIPEFLRLDLDSFLYRYALWILIATAISVFSKSPVRAGINVFGFYAGMIIGYYSINQTVYGFAGGTASITDWIIFAVISPFLAFICWYARGTSVVSVIISAFIAAVMFYLAFSYGWLYFAARSIAEVILWIACIAVLYKNPKQILFVLLGSLVFAVIFYFFPPSFLY